jgi:tRNA-dihydrouridine synthase B
MTIKRQNNDLELKLPFFPAPMAGAIEPPFRMILHDMGAELSFTEMISARGTYEGSKRTGELAGWLPERGFSGAQVFGSDPGYVSFAAARMEEIGHHIIDLNCGCPKRKVLTHGAGGALMKDSDRLISIVSSILDDVEVPVGVKTRSGFHDFDRTKLGSLLQDLESIGCSYVAIHGRSVKQGFRGSANRDVISFASKNLGIPLIASGDVRTIEDIRDYLERGASGVMLGRALLGNPFILRDLIDMRGPEEAYLRERIAEIFSIARLHLDLSISYYGCERGCVKFRTHLGWYIQRFRGRKPFMDRIHHASSREEFAVLMEAMETAWSRELDTC